VVFSGREGRKSQKSKVKGQKSKVIGMAAAPLVLMRGCFVAPEAQSKGRSHLPIFDFDL
jgi:hypothetical protein